VTRTAPATTAVDTLDWDALRQGVAEWAAQRRRTPVFGAGDPRASWLVVGEPPMEDEERQGEPFVGDFGKLLDNMLAAVGVTRRQGAYLTNVLKCRLPEDRAQEAAEVAASLAFLRRQVQLVQPRIIVAMGRIAAQSLLQTNEPPGRLRGRLHTWEGVPLLVTYHPLQLLRTPESKAHAWADLCLAQAALRG
jgi:DNA polymerase